MGRICTQECPSRYCLYNKLLSGVGPISLAPKYILPGPLARFLGPSVAYTCAGELASRVTRVLVLGFRV